MSKGFVELFDRISKEVYEDALRKGWMVGLHELEIIANLHSEVSEAFDALVAGNQKDNCCEEFTNFEVELADIIIRIMGEGYRKGLRVGDALIAKIEYNKTRSYRHGNKKY